MTAPSDYALLAAGSYWDIRAGDGQQIGADSGSNRAPLPEGWTVLTQYDTSGSGANSSWMGSGFSARVFRGPGGEIVISFAGTEFGASHLGLAADFLAGNAPLALGTQCDQAIEAAQLYQRVKAEQGGNITFTGHSLGGGLASVMAVWFDRSAYVFAAAPFENAAKRTDSLSAIFASKAALSLSGGTVDASLATYNPATDFAGREQSVHAWAVKGEVLEATLGMFNWIEGSSVHLYDAPSNSLAALEKHSIELHAAALITPSFATQIGLLPNALERVFDVALYGYQVTGNQQNFLVKIIGNEVGMRNEQGAVTLAANQMLTHFASDLGKLGVNVQGLSQVAQDALVSQGIEWYYWQTADYAGQEFFTSNGPLLQYTPAKESGLSNAQNKAEMFVNSWLTPLFNADGAFGGNLHFEQWTVAGSSAGTSGQALDSTKTQIFVGNAGSDSFTGGDLDDKLLGAGGADVLTGGSGTDLICGGEGADILDGGAGGDWLYGGAGFDTYQLKSGQLFDVLTDSDGAGKVTVGGLQLKGGEQLSETCWISADGQWLYSRTGSGDLVISRGNDPETIIIKDWEPGQLEIVLSDAQYAGAKVDAHFQGDQHPALFNGAYGWSTVVSSNQWAPDGTLPGGIYEADFADVIMGTLGRDVINGFGGNDALSGVWGDDEIDGGAGDDFIVGGAGSDLIMGGEGNDYIASAATNINLPQHTSPTQSWNELPAGATLLLSSATWGIYEISAGRFLPYYGKLSDDNSADVVSGGAGNDIIMGGGGGDILRGDEGDDEITGEGGGDVIEGGDGSDRLYGANHLITITPDKDGNDYLDGGAGDDVLYGQGAADELFGGLGNDILAGDASMTDLPGQYHGDDYLDGEEGNDVLLGMGGDDILFGGEGDDALQGDATEADISALYHGDDYLDGEGGDDLLIGEGGDDELLGGGGADEMYGDYGGLDGALHGQDYLDGGDDNDGLWGQGGDDQLFGGEGDDYIEGDDTDLAATFHGSDYLDGEGGNDFLVGGGRDDVIFGGVGNDVLRGDTSGSTDTLSGDNHGDDYLDGEAGNDSLYGHGGDDDLIGGEGNDQMYGDASEVALAGVYHGHDFMQGGAGNDSLVGGGGSDQLFGGEGDDFLQGDGELAYISAQFHGDDYLDGGDGFDNLWGGRGDDVLLGGNDDDYLVGNEGADQIYGGSGNDIINGNSGANVLEGDDGDDSIYWSGGGDAIDGGAGNDSIIDQGAGFATFRFGRGSGQDVLMSWSRTGEHETPNVLLFAAGIASSEIVARSSGTSLVVSIVGTEDRVTIDDYFKFNETTKTYDQAANERGCAVQEIRLADGTLWAPLAHDGLGVFSVATYGMNPVGGANGDLLLGNENSNQISGYEGDDEIYGGNEPSGGYGDVIWGGAGNDKLFGGSGYDILYGEAGNDMLDGGLHDGSLYGGSGSDTYVFRSTYGDQSVTEVGVLGDVNTLQLADLYPSDVESGALLLEYSPDGLYLILSVPATGASLTWELTTAGISTLNQLVFADGTTWDHSAIAAHVTVQSVYLVGTENADQLTGAAGNDTLVGLGGADTLDGLGGADTLIGGGGNDVFKVDNVGDIAVELAGEGSDQVISTVSYTLPDQVETLTLVSGSEAKIAVGNALDNSIYGNQQDNIIDGGTGADLMAGGSGDDTYYVDNIGDVVQEASSSGGLDTVISTISLTSLANYVENITLIGASDLSATGNSRVNLIVGNAGNNIISGGSNADELRGGAGDDTYTVDNVGDVVVELIGEGNDTIKSSVSYTIAANVETLTLTGGAANTAAGNGANNTLNGNTGANTLWGFAGDDLIDGKTGADTMFGGEGNNTYIVDDIGDVVTELAGEGVDTIQSKVTYTLGANIEVLTLTGSAVVDGIGNELNNILTGNSGVNVLTGGLGDDIYVISTGDSIVELAGEGVDTVQSKATCTLMANLENLTLMGAAGTATGNVLNNIIIGNDSKNTLNGLQGNDVLDGGLGIDTLVGGTGDDTYRFGLGYSTDVIQENDATAGNSDVLQFLSGISCEQLWFRKVSNNLEVSIIGSADKVTFTNWYLGAAYHVEHMTTADGKTLLDTNVQALVTAMASYAPPPLGQTTLPIDYAVSLTGVIQANWQ